MPHDRIPLSIVQKDLRPVSEYKRLITVVRDMALEIKRLDEDNTQLRAAIGMYREVARRYSCKAG